MSPLSGISLEVFTLPLLVAFFTPSFFTPSLAGVLLAVEVDSAAWESASAAAARLLVDLRVTVFTTTSSPAALATIKISGAALGLALARRELMERMG